MLYCIVVMMNVFIGGGVLGDGGYCDVFFAAENNRFVVLFETFPVHSQCSL